MDTIYLPPDPDWDETKEERHYIDEYYPQVLVMNPLPPVALKSKQDRENEAYCKTDHSEDNLKYLKQYGL